MVISLKVRPSRKGKKRSNHQHQIRSVSFDWLLMASFQRESLHKEGTFAQAAESSFLLSAKEIVRLPLTGSATKKRKSKGRGEET